MKYLFLFSFNKKLNVAIHYSKTPQHTVFERYYSRRWRCRQTDGRKWQI